MDTDGLSIICAGLGSKEEDEDGNVEFVKGEYCLDNLKDLLRFLRRDDPTTRDVFKQVCKWNIVSNSLIPIFEYCQDDRNLILNAVKVLVFLTMPLEATSKDFNEQLEYLWNIKLSITHSNVVAVIVSLLEKPLENLECKAFSEDDWKLVQLVLTLFRNILSVQEISAHQTTLGSANQYLSLRDDFLDLLFRENVMDLIIIITQHVGGSCRYLRHDNLLLLEIYHHIFKGQDAESIAKVCREKSKVDEEAKPCLESLKSIMQEETEKRKYIRLHGSRHSKFNGAFTRLTLDGSKTMCKGMPSSATCDKLLKPDKAHRGPLKKIVKDYAQLPTTKRSLLEKLHDFLNQFLTGGYNVLMQSIVQDIEKEHHAVQTSDVLMFFHLAQFVTYFQYHKSQLIKSNEGVNNDSSVSDDDDDSTWFKGDMCGPIAATLNDSMFALVIAKWRLAFVGLKETKNNAFLSVSGSLLKTMIRMLDLVLKMMPERSKEPQTARSILYKLFYDQTDQGLTQFLLNMFRSFDAHKQPKSDLADLVEIIHVVIRLMEKLQAHGTLRVARKSRKARRKKDLKDKENKTSGADAIKQNDFQPAGSEDLPNTGNCDKERSTQMDCGEKEESQVGERQTSGGNPEGDHEESNRIHDPLVDGESNQVHGESNHIHEALGDHGESTEINDNFVVTGADDCNSSADEEPPATDEVDLKMTPLLLSLANSTIISNLCWLLKFYKSNSTATNHYILCLLKRISDDLDLAPMLYQLSLLVIFYDILNEQKACPRKEYENIVQFLTSLVRRMLRNMKDQPLLFVDVLFWKSRKDCHYINVDSIQRKIGEMRKEVRNWGNADDSGAPQGKENTRKSFADALGDDEFDVIIPNQNRFEKDQDSDDAAVEVLHTSGFEGNMRKENPLEGDPQGVIKKKRRLVRNDKMEEEIIGLYEEYKDNINCTQLIAQALDPEGNISSAQVSRKCKKLGLQLLSKRNSNKTSVIVDNDQNKEGNLETNSSLQDINHADGPSDIGRPMQARKRVRAIDETQELKIRSLFEQFKDHKRCSHMIAKELDSDVAVTAAQVSRKLKKLGLRTSRMKNEGKRQNMDEAYADEEDDSDNLTLSLARKRRKSKEDASSYKEMGSSKSVQSTGSNSDDELVLSSILKKSRIVQTEAPESEDKCADASINQDTAGEDSGNLIGQTTEKRDERGEAKNVDVDVQRPNSPHSRSPNLADRSGHLGERGNQHKYDELSASSSDAFDYGSPGSGPENNATTDMNVSVDTMQDEQNYSELEDSGDEQVPNVSPESSVKRRKLRIVMDLDDDE